MAKLNVAEAYTGTVINPPTGHVALNKGTFMEVE